MKLNYFFLVFYFFFSSKIYSVENININLSKENLIDKKNLILNANKLYIDGIDKCNVKYDKINFIKLNDNIFKIPEIIDENKKYNFYLKNIYKENYELNVSLLKTKKKIIPLIINNKKKILFKISYNDKLKKKNDVEFHINTRNTENIIKYFNFFTKDFLVLSSENKKDIYFLSDPSTISYLHFNYINEVDKFEISYIELEKLIKTINLKNSTLVIMQELLNISNKNSESIFLPLSFVRELYLEGLLNICPFSKVNLIFE